MKKSKIEITKIIHDENSTITIERIITVDGVEQYRDKRDASVFMPYDDPIANLESFLSGEQPECCCDRCRNTCKSIDSRDIGRIYSSASLRSS